MVRVSGVTGHSDVNVGKARPEIIVPRTEPLGDYASMVATLIETIAEVAGQDELTVYRALVTAGRDVVRIRTASRSLAGEIGFFVVNT